MEIRPLDASDPDEMSAWHAAHNEAASFGLPHASPWTLEEMRAEFLATDRVGRRTEPFAGYVDGRLVTTGVLELSLLDNLDKAHVEVATPPAERRRGHAAAMLAHLEERAAAAGRDTFLAEASWTYDAPADGAGTVNGDFASSQGYACSQGTVKRALALPVDDARVEALAGFAAPYHVGYVLRSWSGPVPDDVIDGFGRLIGELAVEAPMGEGQDFEAEVFDAARIRDDEQVLATSGRTKYTTIATAPDGEVVAYSEIAVPSYDPSNAFQWGTLVLPAHRGHRLGLATKAANLRRFQEGETGRSELYTWNAEVNEHMIAVNVELGFRPVGRLGELVKKR